MLKATGRPAEIEAPGQVRRDMVHIHDLEAGPLTKSGRSTDARVLERCNAIGVLACLLPIGLYRILERLICSNNVTAKRGEKGWQWLTSNAEAQTHSPLFKEFPLIESLADKEVFPLFAVQNRILSYGRGPISIGIERKIILLAQLRSPARSLWWMVRRRQFADQLPIRQGSCTGPARDGFNNFVPAGKNSPYFKHTR